MSESGAVAVGAVTAYPNLRYSDVDAGIGWLSSALGFGVSELVRDEDGVVVHAQVVLGEAIVMLSTAGAGREPFRSLAAGQGLVYLAVEDPDALHDRAVAAGAEIALELTDTDYGSRDFTVRDPEGNLWSFGTYRPVAG